MSAIGDYVHYYREGYKKYGINKDGSGSNNLSKILSETKKNIKQRAKSRTIKYYSKKQREQLANYINTLFNFSSGNQTNFDSEADKDFAEAYKELIEENIAMAFKRVNESGDVISVSKDIYKGKDLKQLMKKKNKATLGQTNKISKRLEIIRRNIANILKTTNINDDEFKKIDKEVQNLQKIFNEEYSKVDSKLKGKGSKYLDLNEIKSFNELIKKVNDLNKRVLGSEILKPTGSIYQTKGLIFEYAMATAMAKAAGLGIEEFKKSIETIKIGQSSSLMKIDSSRIDDLILKSKLNRNFSNVEDLGHYIEKTNIHESQNKVDVSFSIDRKDFNVSAKNYNLFSKYNLHLLSGTNLLYLMMEESDNMINHWLNILSTHEKGKMLTEQKYREQSLNVLKMSIALSAISGTKKDKKKANLFIVNNNKGSGANSIYIYTVSEVLDKIWKSLDSISIEPTNLNDIRLSQEWAKSGPQERIANLIAQARNQKISASMSKEILTK